MGTPKKVWFKCKMCGEEHPSSISLDESSWKLSDFEEVGFIGPKLNKRASYDKKDMFLEQTA